MKRRKYLSAFFLASFLAPVSSYAINLTTEQDKVSYSIGVDIGKNFRAQELKFTPAPLAEGLKDGLAGQKTQLTDEEMRATLEAFQTKLVAEHKEQMTRLSEKNLKEGKDFLERNKKREDVKTTASGLQYRVVQKGKGKSPIISDTVTTHYRGALIDGTEFDSSYKRGEPVQFPVNSLIPAWTEALQLMKPGDKWELFVPAELAYGEQGVGRVIGPNATLIFELELLSVDKDKGKSQAKAQDKAKTKS